MKRAPATIGTGRARHTDPENQTMKRALALSVLVLTLFCLKAAASGRETADLVLLDLPKGSWLATVRGDASVTVLEEKDGWRRVRLEGWTMAAPGSTPGRAASPGPASAPAATGGARIVGVLAPDIRTGGAPGAGLLVLLARESPALDAEHRTGGEECGGSVKEADRRVEALNDDLRGALNSSNNFRDATTRNDAIKRRLKDAEAERRRVVEDCRARAAAIFQKHAVSRAISDGDGRFAFEDVAPGRYRVVAFDASEVRPRSWSLGCAIDGGGTRVLDPSIDRSAVEADWGIR